MKPRLVPGITATLNSAEFAPLLKEADVAAIFRVDRRTIKRWCQLGYLPPAVKIGGSNRWTIAAITNVIASSSSPQPGVLEPHQSNEGESHET